MLIPRYRATHGPGGPDIQPVDDAEGSCLGPERDDEAAQRDEEERAERQIRRWRDEGDL